MGMWMKAPIVFGTAIMIVTHYLGYLGFGEAFGFGAVMSGMGLFVLADLSNPEDVRSAVLEERERCEREFERQAQRQRQHGHSLVRDPFS